LLRRRNCSCKLLHLRSKVGEATATALQVNEGTHIAVETWQRGLLHDRIKPPVRFLISKGGAFGERDGELLEIGSIHSDTFRLGKMREGEPLFWREIGVHGAAQFL